MRSERLYPLQRSLRTSFERARSRRSMAELTLTFLLLAAALFAGAGYLGSGDARIASLQEIKGIFDVQPAAGPAE